MLSIILLLWFLGTTSAATCQVPFWSDEFDGTTLDPTKWGYLIGDGCDFGICGWGNNELQYYTDQNAVVAGGKLQIIAKVESVGGKEFTSSRIRSLGLGDIDMQVPIRIDARIKPPGGMGMWSAFWMLPSAHAIDFWPRGGEIDIFEHIGRQTNLAQGYLHYGNLYNDKSIRGGPLKLPEPVGAEFRKYSIEKRPGRFDFFVDGYLYQSYTKDDIEAKFTWPFEDVFHFILNVAVGGHFPGYPDETTIFPSSLEVDYVRVYELADTVFPSIEGNTYVWMNSQQERYCVSGMGSARVSWQAPPDAVIGNPFVGNGSKACVTVDFGSESGYITATVSPNDCEPTIYRIPVHVHPYYGVEFSYLGPTGADDQASYDSSTGSYEVVNDSIKYIRDIGEVYDHLMLSTAAITDPDQYVTGDKQFYLSARTTTSAKCTRILIQLEDSALAKPDNYPTGRHSRHTAYLDDSSDWQRLRFEYTDQPDRSTTKVDRITILIDSFVQRSDTYFLKSLDSAVPGCTQNCESFSSGNECRKRAKSEAGACDDGINNDGFGYDGDAPMDCADSDCWDDPVCVDPPTPTPSPEICNDNIDNDGNGDIDCLDEACAASPQCGAWLEQRCDANPACAAEPGELCCPNPIQGFLPCCNPSPAACAVHSNCAARGLTNDCCPTSDTGQFLDCCDNSLCSSNPKCSGLAGPACCPTDEGVFLDCCEVKPTTCQIHPKCEARGLSGECCPAPANADFPNGLYLDCCEPRECAAHPACNGLDADCCPNAAGVYLDCCFLDVPAFAGSTMEFTSVESYLGSTAGTSSSSPVRLLAYWGLLLVLTLAL